MTAGEGHQQLTPTFVPEDYRSNGTEEYVQENKNGCAGEDQPEESLLREPKRELPRDSRQGT
jgi:hypothetical protein